MKIELIEIDFPHMENFYTNCYILTDESTGKYAVVDPGRDAPALIKALESREKAPEYILLTHGHFDHILAAPDIKNRYGSGIAIHSSDSECLKNRKANLMVRFGVDLAFAPCEPDVVLNDGDVITIGDSSLIVMNTPGHSDGCVCFIDEKDRQILSGDTLFWSTVGITDTPDGNTEKLEASLRRLIGLDGNYSVYPGHGPATTLDHERVRNRFIRRMELK